MAHMNTSNRCLPIHPPCAVSVSAPHPLLPVVPPHPMLLPVIPAAAGSSRTSSPCRARAPSLGPLGTAPTATSLPPTFGRPPTSRCVGRKHSRLVGAHNSDVTFYLTHHYVSRSRVCISRQVRVFTQSVRLAPGLSQCSCAHVCARRTHLASISHSMPTAHW